MAKKWYVIHTYSGYEAKVRDALQQRVKQYSLEEKFGEILIPSETVTDARSAEAQPARLHLR
jgi:transcriptional antiterminator NusG